jgi:hypothetical protein
MFSPEVIICHDGSVLVERPDGGWACEKYGDVKAESPFKSIRDMFDYRRFEEE